MTNAQTEFLRLYPLFPAQLLEKFAPVLACELSAVNPDIGAEYKKFFDDVKPDDFAINSFGATTGYALSPSNSRFTASYSTGQLWGWVFSFYGQGQWGFGAADAKPPSYPGWEGNYYYGDQPFEARWTPLSITCYFDRRIFSDLSVYPFIDYVQQTGLVSKSFLFIMSYSSAQGYFWTPIFTARINFTKQPFNGVLSILALHENGKDIPGIDYNLLYEFFDVLEAMRKFSGEIKSAADLARSENQSRLLLYKNDLADKLKAEKNQLENLTLQLTSQTQNDLQSAKRDMLGIMLQVQTLKQTIQNGLRVF